MPDLPVDALCMQAPRDHPRSASRRPPALSSDWQPGRTACRAQAWLEILDRGQRLPHRTRLDAPGVRLVGMIQEVDHEQSCGYDPGDSSDHRAENAEPLARIHDADLERHCHGATEDQSQPQRRRYRRGVIVKSLLSPSRARGGQAQELS